MIKLSLSVLNPYSKDRFKCVNFWIGKITKHKSWEVEIYTQDQSLLEIDIDTCVIGRDHAGVRVVLGLFYFMISAKMYDTRHWNYELGRWENHENRNYEKTDTTKN
jgi:hypothetical protein